VFTRSSPFVYSEGSFLCQCHITASVPIVPLGGYACYFFYFLHSFYINFKLVIRDYRKMAQTIKRRRRMVERVPSSYYTYIQVCCRSLGTGNVSGTTPVPIYKSLSSHCMICINVYINACKMNSRIDDR